MIFEQVFQVHYFAYYFVYILLISVNTEFGVPQEVKIENILKFYTQGIKNVAVRLNLALMVLHEVDTYHI